MTEKCSLSTLQRLPTYLHYLRGLAPTVACISATQIALALDMGEVQVRKDLAAVCHEGKPRIGYRTAALLRDLEQVLGYRNRTQAIIVGVGRLGQALLEYPGFADYGLNIVCGFDPRESLRAAGVGGKQVLSPDEIERVVREENIPIAILTVPADSAQGMADRLVSAGIRGIWNFTPTHIVVPEPVAVRHENLAASLAVLSRRMEENQG